MPITLKLGELLSAKPALERLIQLKFAITTSYKLARRLKIINEALITYDAKRSEIVRELGSPVAGSNSEQYQLQKITPAELKAARDDAANKRKISEESTETEDSKAKLTKSAAEAEAVVSNIEKGMTAWNTYVRLDNELKMIDEVLNIDPIRLAELHASENATCLKCGRAPNEISVEDMMRLYPLLAEDDT
jgi:hypothetical protein